ncbi:MAG: ATP-binding cassette domain-containing protein [Candidatus Methanomethylophilaceae archaeon]
MSNAETIKITVCPGLNKQGRKENFEPIEIRPGDLISIVGPTGSGKTAFINDIEVCAQEDTITKRRILVNDKVPSDDLIRDPAKKPIAMITQNTKCLADLSVREFLEMHRTTRGNLAENIVDETIALGNRFTGEKFDGDWRITDLSGGQTRSLMISDALLISDTPIILLDEIENAGIYKEAVIESLRDMHKAVIFVTHDPYVSMITERRIVMRNGEVVEVIDSTGSENKAIKLVQDLDERLSVIRERLRNGEVIEEATL